MADIITHNWTGYTNGGMTISVSSAYSSYYGWKVFDGSTSSRWITSGVTGWWKIDLGTGYDLLGMVIINGRTAGRAPKNFTIEGSNNDSDWDVLLTVTDETDWTGYEKRYFEFAFHGSYQYYKIDITANNGDVSYIDLGEFELHSTWDGGDVRITHALSEVLRDGDPDVRITYAQAEVLRDGDPDVRITHALVEVLRAYEHAEIDTTTEYVALTNSTTARLIGEVTKSGPLVNMYCFFQYRLEGGAEWLNSDEELLQDSDRFIIDISGLTENETYEYRAAVRWVEGDGTHYEYGVTDTFTAYFIWENGVGFETGELYGVSANDTGLYI